MRAVFDLEQHKMMRFYTMDREQEMQKCVPERQRVVVPARLAVPHQVGALLTQSQQALSLRAAQGAVIPPTGTQEERRHQKAAV